jgi:hypothetical protein
MMARRDRREHAMNRILSVLCLSALVLMLAAPAAFAQNDDNNDDTNFYPPPSITVSTPNFDIRIVGDNWDDETEIIITTPDPANSAAARTLGTATAGPDGRLTANVTAPVDDNGEITLVLAGVDTSGAAKSSEIVLEAAAPGASATSADGTTSAEIVAAGETAAAPLHDAEAAVSLLTPTNTLLIVVMVAAALVVLLGPVRRRFAAK